MCGRFVYYSDPGAIQQRFDVIGEVPAAGPTYNVTPGYVLPVITRQSPNRASLMKWGLIPFWAKDPGIGYKTINARAEGIETKPTYRKPIRSQRCLVPANGFYEWQKVAQSGKEVKVPHYIRLLDQEVFAFAGLYDIWRDAEGQETWTFTIITTEPNELMAQIHNRMPVILPREHESAWLDGATALPQVLAMLKPYPAARMEAYPVSTLVNNPRNDTSQLIEPQGGSQKALFQE